MKKYAALLLPLAMLFVTVSVAAADRGESVEVKKDGDKFEKKVKVKDGDTEYKMTIKRKGSKEFVAVYEGNEYVLRGDAVSGITTEGDYVVVGRIEPEHHFIVTHEIRPVVVEHRTVVKEKIEEKPSEVKIEKKEKIETK